MITFFQLNRLFSHIWPSNLYDLLFQTNIFLIHPDTLHGLEFSFHFPVFFVIQSFIFLF